MAQFRAEKAGFARDAQRRMEGKFDPQTAAKVLRWIRMLTPPSNLTGPCVDSVLKIPQEIQTVSSDTFVNYLIDGLAFGYIIVCLDPSRLHTSNKNTWRVSDKPVFEMARQRERIGLFLDFLSAFGVRGTSQFQTDQLYEKTGVAQVVTALRQLGLEAEKKPGYRGPAKFWSCNNPTSVEILVGMQVNRQCVL
ncbi:myophilin [Clonorchis sinensis]|uniref:Myophilin n=1 Tax=Clonorchis sinensis TaxID=79923 RepID=G7Y9G0_CLOSI|nr:myophilin [Clonorchis sinensis]